MPVFCQTFCIGWVIDLDYDALGRAPEIRNPAKKRYTPSESRTELPVAQLGPEQLESAGRCLSKLTGKGPFFCGNARAMSSDRTRDFHDLTDPTHCRWGFPRHAMRLALLF